MNAEKLHEYIWQGIHKEVSPDGIKFYLPFYFGEHAEEPLCLLWDRKGVLRDDGRTFYELERRLVNIQPYINEIQKILSRCGNCKLIGGRIIVKEHFQTVISGDNEYLDYLGGLNSMLKAIAQISIIDHLKLDEDGRVLI